MHKFWATALTVVVLTVSGCSNAPQQSRATLEAGELKYGTAIKDPKPVVLECMSVNTHGSTVVPPIGQCVLLNASGVTIGPLQPGSCLVHDEGVRFYIKGCREASPGSCKTDLGGGSVVLYQNPCQ